MSHNVIRTPGVSVVIATLNGSKHIEEQLASIVAQTVRPLEIVIGDDGSTDGTVDIVRRFADGVDIPVDVRINESRLGYGENFLRTATRARGTFIAFADQDDVWYPDKLESATRVMSTPDISLWVAGWRSVDEGLAPISDRRLRTGFHQRSAVAYPLYVIHGARMVFRASLIDFMPPEGRPLSVFGRDGAHHDEWAMFAAHVIGRVHQDSRPTMLYRRHPGAVSAEAPSVPSRRWLLSRAGEPPSDAVVQGARSRAGYLRARARCPECADVRAKMLAAADYYDQIVPRLERRLTSRTSVARSRRAAALIGGLGHGDYRPLRAGGLGLWNLMQDGYALVRPPTSRAK